MHPEQLTTTLPEHLYSFEEVTDVLRHARDNAAGESEGYRLHPEQNSLVRFPRIKRGQICKQPPRTPAEVEYEEHPKHGLIMPLLIAFVRCQHDKRNSWKATPMRSRGRNRYNPRRNHWKGEESNTYLVPRELKTCTTRQRGLTRGSYRYRSYEN